MSRLDPNIEVSTEDYSLDYSPIWNDYIPSHTRKAFEDYLLRGYEPGSFITGALCNDLYRATGSADHINLKSLKEIVTWLMNVMPRHSYGNKERVIEWIRDQDGCRSEFVRQVEERIIWRTLKNDTQAKTN